jgi:hypothetical protein
MITTQYVDKKSFLRYINVIFYLIMEYKKIIIHTSPFSLSLFSAAIAIRSVLKPGLHVGFRVTLCQPVSPCCF